VPNYKDFCNLGDFVRINMPNLRGKENYIYVDLYGSDVYNQFWCCPSRWHVDAVFDDRAGTMGRIWNTNPSRDAKCLIYGLKTCGECGEKCDSCGKQCKDVCPKGNC
jgi:hypothetical protein